MKTFRKASILSAGPCRERNGKVSEAVSLIFFDFLRFSSIFFDFLRFSSIFFDFERRAGSGAAGDRNINGFQLKAFRKASILSAGPVRERPGMEKSMNFN